SSDSTEQAGGLRYASPGMPRCEHSASGGRQVPVPAQRTQIRLAVALDVAERGCVQRVALRAVAPFADTHPLPFLTGGFLHGRDVHSGAGAGGRKPSGLPLADATRRTDTGTPAG